MTLGLWQVLLLGLLFTFLTVLLLVAALFCFLRPKSSSTTFEEDWSLERDYIDHYEKMKQVCLSSHHLPVCLSSRRK